MAGSNYDVNIKLDVRKINQQINNLERRISKLNALAQGKKGDSKTLLKNERDKAALLLKQERTQDRLNRKLEKTNRLKKEELKLTQGTTVRGRNFGQIGGSIGPALPPKVKPLTTARTTGGGGVLSGALISGAFPLLFGQGPLGAAAGFGGGLIGGKLGGQTGGFAGGLIATAALTQIQQVIDGVAAVGNAFSETSLNINQVTKSLGLVGTPSAKYLQLLEKTQGKQAAYNESVKRLSRIVGDEGVKNLQEFGDASRQFANDMSILMTRLAAAFAGFANKISSEGLLGLGGISKFTKPFGRSNLLNRAALSKDEDMQSLIAQRDAMLGGAIGGAAGKIKRTAEFKELEEKIINQQKLNEELQKESDLNEGNKLRFQSMTKSISDRTQFLQNSISLGTEEAQIQQEVNRIAEASKLTGKEISSIKKEQIADELRLQKQLEKTQDLYKSIGSAIETGLVDAIEGAINGTKTLGDVARSVFGQIQRSLIQFGVNAFLGGIGIPGFANGGRPPVGRPSVVGERGPELFVPDRAGTIVPNHQLGGMGETNIVVNVDASGSNVEGDEEEGRALGVALSAAIESELIKQKRPGGLLA